MRVQFVVFLFLFFFELVVPVYWFVVKFNKFVWCERIVHDLLYLKSWLCVVAQTGFVVQYQCRVRLVQHVFLTCLLPFSREQF